MHFRITILRVMAVFLCQTQDIIPFPNQCEKTGGVLKVPGAVPVSASDEFAELIPFLSKLRRTFDMQVKKIRKGFFSYF